MCIPCLCDTKFYKQTNKQTNKQTKNMEMLRYVEQSLMKCMHSYTHNIATEKNYIFFQFNCLRLSASGSYFNAKPSLHEQSERKGSRNQSKECPQSELAGSTAARPESLHAWFPGAVVAICGPLSCSAWLRLITSYSRFLALGLVAPGDTVKHKLRLLRVGSKTCTAA